MIRGSIFKGILWLPEVYFVIGGTAPMAKRVYSGYKPPELIDTSDLPAAEHLRPWDPVGGSGFNAYEVLFLLKAI